MKCICPNCGKRDGSENLTFDFTEQFRQKMKDSFARQSPTIDMTSFERVFNIWKQAGRGPTFLSEKNLESWCKTVPTAKGVRGGILSVPFDWWQKQLDAYPEFDSQMEESGRKLLKQMKAAESSQDSEEQESPALEMAVQFVKDDAGDIKFDSVLDARHRTIARERHCPNCGAVMSHWAGRFEELVLTVLGGPRISKSTALSACAHIFLNNSMDKEGIVWADYSMENEDGTKVGDMNWINFSQNCLAMYESNKKVRPTMPATGELIPRFSVLVTIKVKNKKTKRLVLTVVDFPGEYSYTKDYIGIPDLAREQYAELYRNVDCIWYCTDGAEVKQIDVSQSPEDRNKYGYDSGKKPFSTRALVNGMNSFSSVLPENIPVVFLLGKSDTIREDAETQKQLYRPNYQPGSGWLTIKEGYPALLGKDQYIRASRLRRYLKSCNTQLIDGFESAFPVHTYIATSNYGHAFKKDDTAEGSLDPFQTEAPFLWMLAIYGFLPVLEDDGNIYWISREGASARPEKIARENLGMYGKSRDGRQTLQRRSFLGNLFGSCKGG